MQGQSSPALQHVRTLHTGSLQHLQQQSPDGSLFSQPLPQLHPSEAIYQQQQQYALSGPPQPPSHALHYQHGLPGSPAQYAAFPVSYQHASSPRFAVAPPLPLPEVVHHFQSPPLPPRRPQQQPLPPPPPVHRAQNPPQAAITAQPRLSEGDDGASHHGHFQGLKLVAEPPDLEAWRQKLFDVGDTITLTEDEFNTYFPHIDNVYSHRSTQRHKRKRFVSHYWDCRLKGRPPGTKKSTDPDKKKRKRVARERDLCDVKIKITEYFDQQEYAEQVGQQPPGTDEGSLSSSMGTDGSNTIVPTASQPQTFFAQPHVMQRPANNAWGMSSTLTQAGMAMPPFPAGPAPPPLARTPPKKFYTFQRVNGNGGNGKGDGVAGPHKHSLEESDRVKKNSIIRWLAKCEKDDRKKSQVSLAIFMLCLMQRLTVLALMYYLSVLFSCDDLLQKLSAVPANHAHNVILMRLGSSPENAPKKHLLAISTSPFKSLYSCLSSPEHYPQRHPACLIPYPPPRLYLLQQRRHLRFRDSFLLKELLHILRLVQLLFGSR